MSSEINTFCETAGKVCTFGYCDENGCQDRKRIYTAFGISTLHDDDLLAHLRENLSNDEQVNLVFTEIIKRLGDRSRATTSETAAPAAPAPAAGAPAQAAAPALACLWEMAQIFEATHPEFAGNIKWAAGILAAHVLPSAAAGAPLGAGEAGILALHGAGLATPGLVTGWGIRLKGWEQQLEELEKMCDEEAPQSKQAYGKFLKAYAPAWLQFARELHGRLNEVVTYAATLAPAASAPAVAEETTPRWAPEVEERERPGVRVRKGLYPNADVEGGWDIREVVWAGKYWQRSGMSIRAEVDVHFILVEAEMPAFPAAPQASEGGSHE